MQVPQPWWKRVVLVGASVGAGFAITLVLILGGLRWYNSRPKPWDKAAIKARFDYADTQGDEKRIVFYYVLENGTTGDYTLENTKSVIIMAKLKQGLRHANEYLELDSPIFVPQGQRTWIALRLGSPYRYTGSEDLGTNPTPEEQEKYHRAVAAWLSREASNLDGFVIYDIRNHYQIDLPKGW